jgi:hypothetical protein
MIESANFMDPTKNFDHLDPKLKDTYARVMGTTPGGPGDPGQPTADPAALAASPAPDPTQGATSQPQNQFNASPLDQPLSSTPFQNSNEGPNPGTGPTINSIPTDTTTMVAPPAPTVPSEQAPDTNSPATSSFFSNPSPATADPAQNPVQPSADNNINAPFTQVTEPASTPITPYSPEATPAAPIPAIGTAEQMAQPLPSPSSVAQKAPRETSALLRVLYIIAAVIFFGIYTVFWIKVFNLPFLF